MFNAEGEDEQNMIQRKGAVLVQAISKRARACGNSNSLSSVEMPSILLMLFNHSQ